MKQTQNLIFLSLLTLSFSSCASEQWFAMGRHGGCYGLAEFSKNNPVISGARTPAEIKKKLNDAGIDFTLAPINDSEDMMNLTVPSKEWAMMLVKAKYCQEFL